MRTGGCRDREPIVFNFSHKSVLRRARVVGHWRVTCTSILQIREEDCGGGSGGDLMAGCVGKEVVGARR